MEHDTVTGRRIEITHLWKAFGLSHKKTLAEMDRYSREPSLVVHGKKQVIAVRDISFGVDEGDVFVIMGLSGSGKSTLIRCVLRLVEPNAGEIVVNGKNVTAMDKKQLIAFRRTQMAMVFQHFGLLPHRTVLDNVGFGLKVRGVGKKERSEKAADMLKTVGLEHWGSQYPASLSGGMQQRVGLARALVQDADVLLMDEPFSGLDPLIRREMQEELLRLQREMKKTILFVTHDLDEAMRLGNRMAVMGDGMFVQIGTPEEIVQNPVNDYVHRFVKNNC
ncbi:quaternary amine ABC transporter ATP-binding protein [Desulfosarcina ovata]|nr:betaine/proline/choline family ABC transporter ATP-binding protein [Desulfosarcina ovata]